VYRLETEKSPSLYSFTGLPPSYKYDNQIKFLYLYELDQLVSVILSCSLMSMLDQCQISKLTLVATIGIIKFLLKFLKLY